MAELPTGPTTDAEVLPSRWALLRDVGVFQLKLLLDGLRDAVLLPVSLVVALLDLVGVGPKPGHQFYMLLRFGSRTEYWINLFGAADSADRVPAAPRPGVDLLVDRLERVVRQEYERGGITAATKDAVDRALDTVTRSGSRPPPANPPE